MEDVNTEQHPFLIYRGAFKLKSQNNVKNLKYDTLVKARFK